MVNLSALSSLFFYCIQTAVVLLFLGGCQQTPEVQYDEGEERPSLQKNSFASHASGKEETVSPSPQQGKEQRDFPEKKQKTSSHQQQTAPLFRPVSEVYSYIWSVEERIRKKWLQEFSSENPLLEGLIQENSFFELSASQAPNLYITKQGKISGFTGCNQFRGHIKAMSEGPIFMVTSITEKACLGGGGVEEQAYLKALDKIQRLELHGNQLHALTSKGEKVLVFSPSEPSEQ